jgi:hypothetical protein
MDTTQKNTNDQYDFVIKKSKDIFLKKTNDYGTAWRVLRTISITDQIFIKAQRIRTIQEKKQQKIDDDITAEFIGILNYAVIGLIQMQLTEDAPEELGVEEVNHFYDEKISIARDLMQQKNHDYGEAWREMNQESLTDLILMNSGKTIISEGLDANYTDIINYAAFALILIDEKNLNKN